MSSLVEVVSKDGGIRVVLAPIDSGSGSICSITTLAMISVGRVENSCATVLELPQAMVSVLLSSGSLFTIVGLSDGGGDSIVLLLRPLCGESSDLGPTIPIWLSS
mmetsp:Transcript_12857/g.35631  ORF Transcript_12857/g.35631 Transcript_12857/m.35631 type:complete len:105 (+) Transcript_12857:620-934(+)